MTETVTYTVKVPVVRTFATGTPSGTGIRKFEIVEEKTILGGMRAIDAAVEQVGEKYGEGLGGCSISPNPGEEGYPVGSPLPQCIRARGIARCTGTGDRGPDHPRAVVLPLLRFLDRLERRTPTMIDPALAHLYADALAEDDAELEELEALKAAAARPTSLEALTAAIEAEPEELDEHDLEELAILVEAKVAAGTFSDEEAEELGLGEIRDLDDGDRELVLNETGRAVVVRAALRRTSSLGSKP